MTSSLDAHLGYWLRFVSNHVSHAFSLKLEARGVTVAEWVLLRALLDNPGVAPSLLAATLGITRGATSKLVDRLAAKGLVAKEQGEGDRRFQAVSLTSAGRGLVPALAALADENDAAFFGHLAPADRAVVENVMKDIVRRHRLWIVPID